MAACEKNAAQEIAAPISGAFVRFHNYGVNTPGVNFYANDQKVTAVSTATCTPPNDPKCLTSGIEATTGITYGNVASGGNYAQVATGQYTLSSRIAATADNGLAVSSVTMPLADNKFYSYFTSGIYNATTKKVDAFVVEDDLPTTFDYTKAYLRLVNASANAPNVSATITLQGTTNAVTIASNLAYKAASPFVTVVPGTHDITVTIGTTSTTFRNQIVSGGHVFTLALRGDATSTTATGLAISGTANR